MTIQSLRACAAVSFRPARSTNRRAEPSRGEEGKDGLVLVGTVKRAPSGHVIGLIKCLCGKLFTVRLSHIRSGHTKSCGCLYLKRNRMSTTPTYKSWAAMIRRCYNKKHDRYEQYGGRGISVYFEWTGSEGFKAFFRDMGERPEGMTLDRKNVNGNYELGNCRWATDAEQRRNKR